MKWANALSTRPSLEGAVFEVVERSQQLLSAPADLGLVFISSAFASEYSRLMPLLQEQLGGTVLMGCSGSGIIGMDGQQAARELEEQPALSLTLASLPGVKVEAFHLDGEELPDLDSPPDAWVELLGVPATRHPHFVILADPFTSKINDLLQGLDFAYPGSAKVGGLASGGAMGNTIGLFRGDRLYREGAVGVALSGNIVLETIVAQGCKPIGHPFTVKECDRNILLALDDGPCGSGVSQRPLEALKTVIESLNESDRQLAQHSLFIGIARNEFKDELEQGDFLIRNVLGVDPREGAIAVGDRLRPGQRIQFHLRDAQTSAEDLEMLLQRYQSSFSGSSSSVGALMFACLGRGEQLYGQPDFDSRLFRQYVGNIPVSGFFCNGEIGPVGGGTFLHGYTSVFAICHPL
jgi:small ligand-binding sensory domain FIST